MKAAPLRYYRPPSLAEAVGTLAGDRGARLLAGGQSIMPALVARETTVTTLVDIGNLGDVRGVAYRADAVTIGAAEPLRTLERSQQFGRAAPLLIRAIATVGAMSVRSRCSLGGSLAWADPSSQLPAALAASRARITTTLRTEPAATFVTTLPADRLAPAEIILSITVPAPHRPGVGLAHVRRTHITWPTAGAAAMIDDDGTALALYGAGPTHVAVLAASDEEALARATAAVSDLDDRRASADYRRRVLPVLARRAVAQARRERDGAR